MDSNAKGIMYNELDWNELFVVHDDVGVSRPVVADLSSDEQWDDLCQQAPPLNYTNDEMTEIVKEVYKVDFAALGVFEAMEKCDEIKKKLRNEVSIILYRRLTLLIRYHGMLDS
jgi:hypothetical protein